MSTQYDAPIESPAGGYVESPAGARSGGVSIEPIPPSHFTMFWVHLDEAVEAYAEVGSLAFWQSHRQSYLEVLGRIEAFESIQTGVESFAITVIHYQSDFHGEFQHLPIMPFSVSAPSPIVVEKHDRDPDFATIKRVFDRQRDSRTPKTIFTVIDVSGSFSAISTASFNFATFQQFLATGLPSEPAPGLTRRTFSDPEHWLRHLTRALEDYRDILEGRSNP